MPNADAIVGIVIAAVIVALIVTNPSGDKAVLTGVTGLSTGTIGSIGAIKGS
jgi:hypothetical protein